MKKFLALVLVICALSTVLVSCGYEMDDFVENLSDSHKIQYLDYEDIEDYADIFDVNADNYGIKSAIEAKSTSSGKYALIFECDGDDEAESLVYDLDDAVDMLNDYYSFTVTAVAEDNFVLIGASTVIDAALAD